MIYLYLFTRKLVFKNQVTHIFINTFLITDIKMSHNFNETSPFMDSVVNFFMEHEDLRTKSWFLSNNPGPLFTILATYLYFCLYAGPRYMRDRKPFELKTTMIVYNIFQVVLSYVLFHEVKLQNYHIYVNFFY